MLLEILLVSFFSIYYAHSLTLVGSFYVPRSNPDGIDINARCLDNWVQIKASHKIVPFDGQNWEENAATLAHLSQ
jgi:hypothetical protein